MCPLAGSKQMKKESKRWPKLKEQYVRSTIKAYNKGKAEGKPSKFDSGEEYFEWWLNYEWEKEEEINPNQESFDDGSFYIYD